MKGDNSEKDRGKTYSLERLLYEQGGAMQKHPSFPILAGWLRSSPALARLRLPRRAYRLLVDACLEERFLPHFYAAYRIRPHPFFPLLLRSVRDCAEMRAEARAGRGRRILAIMRTYPEDVLGLIKYLAKAERERNADFPVWKKELFPRTLKRARETATFGLAEWLPFLSAYIRTLRSRYRRLTLPPTEELFARMLLRCLRDPRDVSLPDAIAVDRRYRELRSAYAGGSAEERARISLLAAARTTLLRRAAPERAPDPGRR